MDTAIYMKMNAKTVSYPVLEDYRGNLEHRRIAHLRQPRRKRHTEPYAYYSMLPVRMFAVSM